MAERDRARRQRPRRARPTPPPAAPSAERNGGSATRPVASRPKPSWAWAESVPLAAAPEAAAAAPSTAPLRAEARAPQPVRSNGTPTWAWKGDAPPPPIAVVFADSLAGETAQPAPAAAPAPTARPRVAAASPRGTAERLLLLAVPAAVALGLVILLSRALPEPSGGGAEAMWWVVLAAAGLATLVAVDLGLRRLRPTALAGAGLPRLGGGVGEMTVVVAIAALLAGAGILHIPASTGTSGTVNAIHASQPQGPTALAPAEVPPLAMTQAPAVVPVLPAQRTPITGGGGVDLPVLALDPATVSHPAVVRSGGRVVLPLPAPLRANRGGAAADASALSGILGPPDAAPVTLGPVAPASAATTPARPRSESGSALTSCGGDGAPCPATPVDSLGTEATSAFATVQRDPAPDCATAGRVAAPPVAASCTQGIHLEMLLDDPGRAVVADGVSSSSLSTGCGVAPVGQASVGDLEVGGIHVAGGPGALVPTATPEPNTAVALALGTVVLNEQRPDRGGRGLTVNAVHIVAPASMFSPFSLDMVIGHSHSASRPGSACAAAPPAATPAPPSGGATPGTPDGVLPDVTQLRRVVRGLLSL